jgi:hypothetical protein
MAEPWDADEGEERRPRRRSRRARDAELELSRGPEPVLVPEPADEPVDPFDELLAESVLSFEDRYDADELAAIERGPRRTDQPVTKVSQWRRRSALGAVLTGMALGLQEVFDPEEERSIVIEVDADGEPLDLPVDLFLDPDSPAGSLCIVHASDNRKPPEV